MKYKEDFILELVEFYKKQLSQIRDIRLTKNEEGITHQHILSYSTYSPWVDDLEFQKVYKIIKGNTLVDIYRCYELWNLVKKNEHLKGDIVEVGVWRGGTGALLAKAAESYSNCKVYLADTFTGVVKASSQDTTYKGGEHADTSIEMVEKLLADLHVNNTVLLQGIFPNEVHLNNAQPAIRLCHIDVDTYASAKDIFDYIWPYIVPGGCVVFDDYGFWGCEGVTKLCNEISLSDATFIHNINGHGIFIKV